MRQMGCWGGGEDQESFFLQQRNASLFFQMAQSVHQRHAGLPLGLDALCSGHLLQSPFLVSLLSAGVLATPVVSLVTERTKNAQPSTSL